MRTKFAPILIEAGGREAACAARPSPVEKADVSEIAVAKAASKQTPDGLPVRSFPTSIAGPRTLTLNDALLPGGPGSALRKTFQPTALR